MKKFIVFFLVIITSSTTFAQDKVFKMTPQDSIVPKVKEEKAPKQAENDVLFPRIVGGSLWFNALGAYRYFDSSIMGAYKINKNLHMGVSATYRYINSLGYVYANNNSTGYSVYGGSAFLRYMFLPSFYGHAEYEYMYGLPTVIIRPGGYFEERTWVSGALIGGSYRSQLGQHIASVVTVLYNITYVKNVTPTTYPLVIRVGIEFEF